MPGIIMRPRSEEHTSELQSHVNLVCRLLLEKQKEVHLLNLTPQEELGRPIDQWARALSQSTCPLSGAALWLSPYRRNAGHSFFHVPATTDIYTLSLHDALPI